MSTRKKEFAEKWQALTRDTMDAAAKLDGLKAEKLRLAATYLKPGDKVKVVASFEKEGGFYMKPIVSSGVFLKCDVKDSSPMMVYVPKLDKVIYTSNLEIEETE